MHSFRAALCGLLCLLLTPALAERLRVATAASFVPALDVLAPAIREDLDISLEIIPGASGALFAQIRQGAPFDLFLSADELRPQELVRSGHARADSMTRYSRGKLVLYSPRRPASAALLQQADARLAIANPVLAPFGSAAQQALARLAPQQRLQLIQGNSVSQAFHFAWSGNADMALVAHAQVLQSGNADDASVWVVPTEFYEPLYQAGVIPRQSKAPAAAQALLDWLTGEARQSQLVALGYLPLAGGTP